MIVYAIDLNFTSMCSCDNYSAYLVSRKHSGIPNLKEIFTL